MKNSDILTDTNHLHLWSLGGEKHVFTAHLILKNIESYSDILEAKKIREILKPYKFNHSTIEVELDEGTSSLIVESHNHDE